MKKYIISLVVSLVLFYTASLAQTVVVTDLKKPIEWANNIKLDGTEVTLSNAKLTCETFTINANVRRIKVEGKVDIRCQKIIFEADSNPILLYKTGTNEAFLSVLYANSFTHNNRILQTGDGEVELTVKKK
jgi:hypothetical protein